MASQAIFNSCKVLLLRVVSVSFSSSNTSTEELIYSMFQRRAVWDPIDPLHKHIGVLKKHWEDILYVNNCI